MFKLLDIKVAYNTKQTLKNVVGNPKNKTESLEKSIINKINNQHGMEKYYGQTGGIIGTRCGVHSGYIKYINRKIKCDSSRFKV